MKTRKVERCPICKKKHAVLELQDITDEKGKIIERCKCGSKDCDAVLKVFPWGERKLLLFVLRGDWSADVVLDKKAIEKLKKAVTRR
jgi:hypothetical protein